MTATPIQAPSLILELVTGERIVADNLSGDVCPEAQAWIGEGRERLLSPIKQFAGQTMSARWLATASNVSGISEGEISIRVAGKVHRAERTLA
jgi:hypothetical protein